jgi:hypothetical protein
MNRKSLLLCLLALSLSLVFVSQASANPDSLQIHCVSPTVCTAGSTSLVSSGTTVTFNVINTSQTLFTGTLYLAIAVPTGGAAPVVNGATFEESVTFNSGDIFTALNENCTLSGNCNDINLSNVTSASAQAGVTATTYTLYEYNAGAFSSVGGSAGLASNVTVTAPAGSLIVAFLENSSSQVFEQTPLSEGLTITPEPGSMALFGSGLLLLGGVIRRRLHV